MNSALWHLFLARVRTFYREPETVFWTFIFPLLLAIGLGVAFRSRPPEPVRVGLAAGPYAQEVEAALADSTSVKLTRVDRVGANKGLSRRKARYPRASRVTGRLRARSDAPRKPRFAASSSTKSSSGPPVAPIPRPRVTCPCPKRALGTSTF